MKLLSLRGFFVKEKPGRPYLHEGDMAFCFKKKQAQEGLK